MGGVSRYATLAHDVGKYLARTARNLPAGDVPDVLLRMLVKDLYSLDGERRASAVFATLRGDLEGLDECARKLERIDALEDDVRAGRPEALREAAQLALEVEATLRGLLS